MTHPAYNSVTTIGVSSFSLLQASQVLKGIKKYKLIANSRRVGKFFESKFPFEDTGIGLHRYLKNGKYTYTGRLAPPLTFTEEDVDRWLKSVVDRY